MQVDRGLVHAGHESRSAGRTNRRGRKHPRVSNPQRRQFIEIRGVYPLPAEASKIQIAVVGDQPKDVGLILRKNSVCREQQQEAKKQVPHGGG